MQSMKENGFDFSPFSTEQITELYRACPNHLKRMSKDLICVILTGFIQQARLSRADRCKGGSVSPPSVVPLDECLPFDELNSLLVDFRVLSEFVNTSILVNKLSQEKPSTGYVYVAKFDDGHVKIGSSMYPQKRLRQISRGNQAKLIDSWVSDSCTNYIEIEKMAHENFKTNRKNGEFFAEDFDTVSTWVEEKINKLKV